GVLMAWEWARLCQQGQIGASGGGVIAIVLAAILSEVAAGVAVGLAVAAAGAAILFATTRRGGGGAAGWLALGALWLAVPCILLLWLSRPDGIGPRTVLWIFAVVWATDIGAYAVGRRLGGPRLAPRWSPGKTWAGLLGGAGCAALAGWGIARALGVSQMLPLVLVSAGLAIVGQF